MWIFISTDDTAQCTVLFRSIVVQKRKCRTNYSTWCYFTRKIQHCNKHYHEQSTNKMNCKVFGLRNHHILDEVVDREFSP
jgi:stalled ribosome alternative rescue factor ArfA